MNKQSALIYAFLAAGICTASASYAKKNKQVKTDTIPSYLVDTLIQPVPMNRIMFFERPLKLVKQMDARDGMADGSIHLAGDESTNNILTQAITGTIPQIAIEIENMDLPSSGKVGLHQTLYALTQKINNISNWSTHPIYIQQLVLNFRGLITARASNTLDSFVNANLNQYTIENRALLYDREDLVQKVYEDYGTRNPEKMITQLSSYYTKPYADTIIAVAAKVIPDQVLNYAMSTGGLAQVIARNPDPMVQAVVKIAKQSKKPLNALPFLGDVYRKKITVAEIDKFVDDPIQYYKNLVRLKTAKETIAAKTINDELAYRSLYFVRAVNDLHDNPNPAVRFKSVEPFNAPELYFLMVGAQDEIYTSSFTGMFRMFMNRLAPMAGDQLLDTVDYTHFRTFIRMAANYNTLAQFLGTMKEGDKTALLKKFVTGLENGDRDDLEDAVDVADVFGSVSDSSLMQFLKEQVTDNYERCGKLTDADKARKGLIVYGLLSTIFNNSSQTNSDLNNDLPIPPVTYMPIEALKAANGTVYQQAFFYGDEDGQTSFESFMANFKNASWKINETNKEWVVITAASKDHPVVIYANRPLKSPDDEKAQRDLVTYLNQQNIVPSIIIHRGHSFHLSGTLDYLTAKAKVVILGSCGGFHNLAMVLDKSPDAAIISSKQTGARAVNDPIIRVMESNLLEGRDINWIADWQKLTEYFNKASAQDKELFSDYIPPNKNLGAIFIKAYRKMEISAAEGNNN